MYHMVTIYDIAKKANVSPMTVSRVINKSQNIRESTRKKVEDAIKELDYIPNSSARSLTSKKSKILSLVITDITNPFFTKVARGAEDKAMQMGYQLLLCNSDENLKKESNYINMLISTGADGVLITPTGDESKKNLRTLNKYNIPFILLDRKIEGIECDEVNGDSREGTRKLLEHLINMGHTKIALINGPLNISTARERQKTYIDTLKAYKLSVDDNFILQSHYKQEDGDENILKILSLSPEERPTAIFAANNFIAINTIKELRRQNIRVPEEISVVCFDDLEPKIDLNPFLTVVSQPAYNFGFIGTQLLIERIEKTAPPEYRKIMLPSELIIRNSSSAPKSN
jgi:LacI family transcriptional regulator